MNFQRKHEWNICEKSAFKFNVHKIRKFVIILRKYWHVFRFMGYFLPCSLLFWPHDCLLSKERKWLPGKTTWPVRELPRNIICATPEWVLPVRLSSLCFPSLLKQTPAVWPCWDCSAAAGAEPPLYVALRKQSWARLEPQNHPWTYKHLKRIYLCSECCEIAIFTSVLQSFSHHLLLLGMSCNWEELQGGAMLVLQLAAL